MKAAEKGRVDTMRILLDNNAVVDTKDHTGETALMKAAKGEKKTHFVDGSVRSYLKLYPRHVEAVRLLLERGAKVDEKNTTGETALTLFKKEWQSWQNENKKSIEDLLANPEKELENIRERENIENENRKIIKRNEKIEAINNEQEDIERTEAIIIEQIDELKQLRGREQLQLREELQLTLRQTRQRRIAIQARIAAIQDPEEIRRQLAVEQQANLERQAQKAAKAAAEEVIHRQAADPSA